jgi:phosphotransferase system enzyme I (PtsI)
VDAAHKAKVRVSICGEMAGESLYVPILLGLQLDSLSMNPQSIPRVKNLICRSKMRECRRFVAKVLQMSTAEEISALLQEMVVKTFPEEFKVFDSSTLTIDGSNSYKRKKRMKNKVRKSEETS